METDDCKAGTIALKHGLSAILSEGEPVQTPPRVKPPPKRRWMFNSHLWEECACAACAARRAGRLDVKGKTVKS